MKIRPAEPVDLPAVVNHLGRTFAADPSVGWVVRKTQDPVALLTGLYEIIAREVINIGHIDTAWDGDEYLGAAVWMPPRAKQPRSALGPAIRLLPQIGRAWPTVIRYMISSGAVKLPFPAWYLSVIAVEDNARGRGVGSALLDAGLERVGTDAARLEATSERAASLYKTRGFIRLGEVKTVAPEPEIIMWRPTSDK